jgi:RNA polymerase sigma-70 factor (ECF subfamily)
MVSDAGGAIHSFDNTVQRETRNDKPETDGNTAGVNRDDIDSADIPPDATGRSTGDSRSDQQLVADANAGEVEAFEVLYTRHRDWVLRIAYRFTRDRDDALDVLQETFIYLAGKFPGLKLTARLTTFLYPAVRNIAITHRRKRELRDRVIPFNIDEVNAGEASRAVAESRSARSNRPIGESGPGSGSEPASPIPASSSGSSVEVTDDLSTVLSAVLTDPQREILLMRFVDDMTPTEIAAALNIPIGTAKSRIHGAIAKLREDPQTRVYFLGE